MSFRRNIILASCSLIAFSQSVSSMEQDNGAIGSGVGRLNVSKYQISKDQKESTKFLAGIALQQAGIYEKLTNDPIKVGGYGAVCFTKNYAVKISDGEFTFGLYDQESNRLLNVTQKLIKNPPKGMNFCLPLHIFKVYIDGKDKELHGGVQYGKYGMETNYPGAKYDGYNVSIAPRLYPQTDIKDVMTKAIRAQDEKALKTVRCLGDKMGQFQNWGLAIQYGYSADKTCLHGDMNPNNILVMKTHTDGSNATFTFIDNADYSDAKTSTGGSLVSDLTYATYFFTAVAQSGYTGSWDNGLEKTLQNFFAGYVKQLSQTVCKKLMEDFYGKTNNCLTQTRKDIKYLIKDGFNGSYKIPMIQTKTFAQAYKGQYGEVIMPQPKPVFTVPGEFNGLTYVHMYGDLLEASKTMSAGAKKDWGLLHYWNNGVKEGRSYFPFGIFYVNKYEDLYKAFKHLDSPSMEATGRKHYETNGRSEKRDFSFPWDFSGLTYVTKYPDLVKASQGYVDKDEKNVFGLMHYVSNGYREKRNYK